MELKFTDREIGFLWHTAQGSFYHEQWRRFDVKGDEMFPTEGGVLVWCGQEYLNAKIMWDEELIEWVVWLDLGSMDDL